MPVDLILVLGVSAGVIGFALRRGSHPEKLGAAIVALNLFIDLVVAQWLGEWDFSAFSSSRFLIDLAEFCLLFLLAWNANRLWPIVSAASQLVAVGGSLVVLGSDRGMQVAYWALTQLPLIAQLLALALGTWFHWKRMTAIGPYRDWRAARLPHP